MPGARPGAARRIQPPRPPRRPGADPLTGAQFFIPGPAKGSAASAIAQLVGLNPKTMPLTESWASFAQDLSTGSLSAKLARNPGLAHEVTELSKIAAEPEAQRLSIYSEGGGPGAIFGQAEKIFCSNLAADPGSIPIFNTYFLHAKLGGCPTTAQIDDYMPTFRRQVNEMAEATDRRPAVFLLELDALGSSGCMAANGALPTWEAALRYEVNTMGALPHTVVYVEGGYSDSNSVDYTARALNAIGIDHIRASSPTTPTRTGRSTRSAGRRRSPSAPTAPTSSSTPLTTATAPAGAQPGQERQRRPLQPARARPRPP